MTVLRMRAMPADGFDVGWESLGHVLFLLAILLPASLVLRRAGVPADILSAAMWIVLAGAVIVPTGLAWSPGYDAFARLDRRLPVPLLAMLPAAAMLPAGIAIAFLSPGMEAGGWIAMAAFICAAILSVLARIAIGRSAEPFAPGDFLHERFDSRAVAQAASLLLALLLLILLCSQAAAFGRLAEQYFGLGHGKAIALCLAFSVLQIWLSGARGIVLGSAGLGMAIAILAAIAWWQPDLPASAPAAVPDSAREIALLALPFIPFSQLSSTPIAWALTGGVIAVALAPLPAFGLLAPSGTRPMRKSCLAIATSLLLLLAFGATLHRIIPPGSDLPAVANVPSDASGFEMIGHFARLLILTGLMVSAAVPLHTLSVMASSMLQGDGRGYLPARRLALARIAIPGIALGAGCLAYRFEMQIPAMAQFAVALIAGAAAPVFLFALLRPLPQAAVLTAMAAGAITATATFIAGTEGANLIPADPMVSAALLGMAAAFPVLVIAWLVPRFPAWKGA